MKVIRVGCRRCGHEFRADVLDREEERDPNRHPSPLQWEWCGSTDSKDEFNGCQNGCQRG
jgi:hypothetical protein